MSKPTPDGGNPEDLVIADIDALIDDCMARGVDERGYPLDNYHADRYDKCEICGGDWHGLREEMGCPGAYGSEEDKKLYQAGQFRVRHSGGLPSHTRQALGELADVMQEVGEDIQPVRVHRWLSPDNTLDNTLVLASPEMTDALTEHINRYPEDEETLMRRFRDLVFTPDGRPVPWTLGGLRTVLGGNNAHVQWAMRQQGFVHLGRMDEEGIVRLPDEFVLHQQTPEEIMRGTGR